MYFGDGGIIINWSIGQPASYVQPTCSCGKSPATRPMRFTDGSRVSYCDECADRLIREDAVSKASGWLTAAFRAVAVDQRARLYKQLAIAFHPDQGGDARLMVTLNDVRKAFP